MLNLIPPKGKLSICEVESIKIVSTLQIDYTDIRYCGIPLTVAVLHNENYEYHKAACHFLFEVAKKSKGVLNTQKARASDLKRFLNSISSNSMKNLHTSDFKCITDHQMNIYLAGLQKVGLAEKSIARHIDTLNEFYFFAYNYGYTEERRLFTFNLVRQGVNLQLSEKATSNILSQYIQETDFHSILSHIVVKKPFLRLRDELALKCGYYLGIRTEELVKYDNFLIINLKAQFPNNKKGFLEQGFIKIIGKGYKLRRVPVCTELKTDLFRFLYGDLSKEVGVHLFERRKGMPIKDLFYGSNTFKSARDNFLAKNLVPALLRESFERWVFHSLRHTRATNFVTYCEDMDMGRYDPLLAIPQWMGHSNPETTKLYICAEALLNRRLSVLKKLDQMSIQKNSRAHPDE